MLRCRALAAILAALLAACHSTPHSEYTPRPASSLPPAALTAPTAAPAAPAPPPAASIPSAIPASPAVLPPSSSIAPPRTGGGRSGLDLPARDTRVKPGDDFFMYANGSWYHEFGPAHDSAGYSAFEQVEDVADGRVRKIVEEAAAAHAQRGTPEQKIGDYYTSFTDEARIEALGLAPIAADLQKIRAARNLSELATLFGTPGYISPIELSFPPDLRDPSRYSIVVEQAGIGLPDREYYLKDDPQLAKIRGSYKAYIAQMLELGGVTDAAPRAARIFALETELARVQWSIEDQRDVEKNYNPRTKAQLVDYARGFPWQTFLNAAGIGRRNTFIVSQPTAVRATAALIARTRISVLQDYLTFHYLSDFSAYLPKRFDQAHFAFFGTVMRGQVEDRERWRRGIDAVSDALGEEIGQLYVARYFPAESKAKMQVLVSNLLASLGERIGSLSWMTPPTRNRAREKLAAFAVKVGYPDHWKDYSTLDVRPDDLIGNVKRASQWEIERELKRLDSPVDRDEWQMNVHQVNAYYNPLNNEIVFPAAILQPPFFDPNVDAAANYGGIGAIIGHEIVHGFDDQGRKFAADGSLRDWWTREDSAAFDQRARRLIAEFSAFEVLPGLHVKGENTIGENIGDLGGLEIALNAYRISLHGSPAPAIEGLTGEQRFFIAWAQAWRARIADDDLRNEVMTDVHSPAYWRVNGPLPNIDAWYRAFDVRSGDKLYLPPSDRVDLW